MKISAIPVFTQKTLINRTQIDSQMSVPLGLKTLGADTVSFKGLQDNDSIMESFGLVKKNDNKSGINNIFKISQKINDEGKKIIDTFEWDSEFGKVKFFGDEKTLAKYLKENHSGISSLAAASDAKYSYISYKEDKLQYKLKYSKDTHELVQAATVYIKQKNNDNKAVERFILNPSSQNPGKYAAQYRFIKNINGEVACDRTEIAFDSDLNIEKTHSSKSFYYSDGEKAESNFEQIYDQNTGSVETIEKTGMSCIY